MAELISFSEDECGAGSGDSDSGVAESYIAKCMDLSFDLATFDIDGNLLDIPWATISNPYTHVVPSNDESAYYNQKYDDVNDIVIQEGYFRIVGLNATNVSAAGLYKDGCCFVAIHVLQNGTAIIQGVEKVFYDEEFHLVPSGGKTTAKSVNVNTNSGEVPARLDFVLSSYSEHFSLFIEDINPFFDIEPPEIPTGTPTISNTVTGALIGNPTIATADCGHGTVKTTVYLNNNPSGYVSVEAYPFDAAAHFCGMPALGATSIQVSGTVTTLCGTVADVDTIPITVTGGIISAVGGVACGLDFSPTVELTISDNIITAMDVNTHGLPIANQYIAIIINGFLEGTLPLTFPINLNTYLCGDGPYTAPITLEISASVAVTGQTTAYDEVIVPVTVDAYGYINSVAGVACPPPVITAPSVSATLYGKTLEITWDGGGDIGAVRTLTLANGSNSISLDTEVGIIDLGDVLYGEESAGATDQTYTLYANITNSVDSDDDTSVTVPVITRNWSAGRFIHTVNGVSMVLPVISGAAVTGSTISSATVDVTLWKSIQIRFDSYRNPNGGTVGEFISDNTTRIYDSITGLNIALNLSTIYCGTEHVTGDNVKVRLVPISGGVDGAFYEESIPVTVDGSNLITSVNGVSC